MTVSSECVLSDGISIEIRNVSETATDNFKYFFYIVNIF